MINLSSLFHTEVEDQPNLLTALELTEQARLFILQAQTEVRNALREGIPKLYREGGNQGEAPVPRFFTQGSWAYKTLNAPAQSPQQADVDDGCYLPLSFLSQTKRPSVAAQSFFGYAEKALEELVAKRKWTLITDKATCIRIEISPIAHIDIPLYAIPDTEFAKLSARMESMVANEGYAMDSVHASFSDRWSALPETEVLLAHREENWIESDPRPVKQWFIDQVATQGIQLRRLVRYLKAFRDWKWKSGGPSSILLMAAAAPLFEKQHGRDDLALLIVLKELPNTLRVGINNPTNDEESLTQRLRGQNLQKDLVEEAAVAFEEFAQLLEGAINASNAAQSVHWLRTAFGNRFPNRPDLGKIVSSVAGAIASTPAQQGAFEMVDRTRAG